MSADENVSEAVLKQFECNVNKWTEDLMDNEADLINKATQINDYDKLIKNNGETLNAICSTFKNVLACQKKILIDLDFIKSQQNELEIVLAQLEKSERSVYLRNGDERKQLYELAENTDTNMKRLAEDLKEVIETINEEAMRGFNPNDPILQIRKILNANVSSLKWIEANTINMKVFHEKISEREDKDKEEEHKSPGHK